MSPPRSSGTDLSKLLDAAADPIYALDARRRIVFLNTACRAWLGEPAGELIGRECSYHSTPDEHGQVPLTGLLCPPPEVFLGQRCTAEITVPPAQTAGVAPTFQFEFLPLGRVEGEGMAALAIGQRKFLTAAADKAAAPGEEATSAELHAALARLRVARHERFRTNRLLGDSPALRLVRAQVALAAESLASVLVVGPPGSGRQQVAQTIHYARPPEALGPLVPLACALLGAELLQASIRGLARSKAHQPPERWSTLLLNDADRMPAEAQAELAGFMRLTDLPLRIVSTSRRPLVELAAAGEFRPDLACALSTVLIELPPLVERTEDLPLVAQSFLEAVNARGAKQLSGFAPEALDALAGYNWPGGLDELAEFIAEAHARAEGSEIKVADLPDRIALAADAVRYAPVPTTTIMLEEFLAQIERELIERALAEAKGNKTKAAQLLGMTRPRLYRRLVQLGLESE